MATAIVASAQIKPTYQIGTEYYSETYRETVNGRDFAQERAMMHGVNGTVGLTINEVHAVKVLVRYAEGKSDYTGAIQGQAYGTLRRDGQDRNVWEVRAAYEYTTAVLGHAFTPSVALGYRGLTDHLEQAGAGGYKRHSEYDYLTLGLSTDFQFGESAWRISPKAGYSFLLSGRQHSYLPTGEAINNQSYGRGVELSAPITRTLQNRGEISVTPFYRYWKIGDSQRTRISPTTVLIEPDNITSEFGVNLSYAF